MIRRIRQWAEKFSRLQIGVHASSASFFLALSVFPALLLILSLLRYTALSLGTLWSLLEGFLPEALLPYAEGLVRDIYGQADLGLVSLSALTAFWSASRGIHGFRQGLRAVYGLPEQRGYFRSRLRSLGYTLAFLALLILTLVLQVFGKALVEGLDHPFFRFLSRVLDLRWLFLLGLQTGLFTALFCAVDEGSGLGRAIPGALVASLCWLLFSQLYSLYLDYFGDQTQVYGSIYTAALGMLWLYLSISILFFGGALNRFLEEGTQ